MRGRNLSIEAHFEYLGAGHTPKHRFAGTSEKDWRQWRDELLPEVRRSLGPMPPTVPLKAETIAEWRDDGLIKRKVLFDVEPGLAATGYVFRPDDGDDAPKPAILCCHGHGPFGKDSVMGVRSSPEMRATIEAHNYDYGLKMARAGFVTMAIDWRGFGERDDRRKPYFHDVTRGRDICNVHFLRGILLGRTMLGGNVHDGMRAIDYLCEQPFVDAGRLGVMGLSFGGTMTTWLAVCDQRLKAADIICYSDRFAAFGLRNASICGNQIVPELFALCDVPDLQGLIAPRPLLVEIGVHDGCFLLSDAMDCQSELEKIYAAAGASDRLELDLFDGPHAWGENRSLAFFRNNLCS